MRSRFSRWKRGADGGSRPPYLEENVAAADVELTAEQLAALDQAFRPGVTAGERDAPGGMASVEL